MDQPALPSLRDPATLIATFFGTGLARIAPGTVGSVAAALPIWIYLETSSSRGLVQYALIPALALALVYALGVWATARYSERLGEHDPGSVVIDEVAGMLTATLVSQLLAFWLFSAGSAIATIRSLAGGGGGQIVMPRLGFDPAWQQVLLLLLLFRAFDILKPWPVNLIDRKLHSARSVLLDDMMAGLYAGLAWALVVFLLAERIPISF